MGLDQVVLFSEPDCSTNKANTHTKSKSSNNSAQIIGPNSSEHTKIMKTGNPSSGITDKLNKTKRAHVEDTVTFYPVYVYLNDKNGTYDQPLTESFIDLWNLTKADEGMFFNKVILISVIPGLTYNLFVFRAHQVSIQISDQYFVYLHTNYVGQESKKRMKNI